jgi:hypothetical protein
MQGEERSPPEDRDPNFASHQAFVPQRQLSTFLNQKSLGRSLTLSSDGSILLPRTNLLASQIFSRLLTIFPRKLHHRQVTILAGTGTQAMARDGHRRNRNRLPHSKQVIRAHCLVLNRHYRLVRIPEAHLMARTARSVRAWRARRIAADVGGMSLLPLGLWWTTRNAFSNALSAQIHLSQSTTGLAMKSPSTYLWKSGYAHR